jgi:2TM domain
MQDVASAPVPDDRNRYERARRRVRQIRAFYVHCAIFAAVNIVLHVINFVAAPKVYWAFWPLLGWSIGLLAHGLASYRWMPFIGKDWEERKIRELMETDRRDAISR